MASRTNLNGVLQQNQRTSKTADDRFPSHLSSKHQGKVREGKRRDADNENRSRSNALGHSSKDCANGSFKRDDELVKYMSKLPGYLQREEREGKVLNIGVLNWGSLEKWKHSQKGGRATECNNALSSGISGKTERKVPTRISGVVPKVSHRCKIDDQSASCSDLSKHNTSRDLQHSVHRVPCTQEPELGSRDSLNKQQKAGFNYKSSGRDHAVTDPGKSRKTHLSRDLASSLFSETGNSGGQLGVKQHIVIRDGENKKRVERMHAAKTKQKALDPVIDTVIGAQSVRSTKFSVALDSMDRETFKNDGRQKITDESQESEAGLAPRRQENQFGNIFRLRPRKHTRSALPGEFLKSDNDNLQEAKQDEFSTDFAIGNNNYSELRSQIPRSCSLSLDFERDSESLMVHLGVDLSPDSCTNELFGRKHIKTASRMLDQEKSEEESRRRRHPSPGKRFSFSFSRLSRSFSFKEDSASQPLSSDDSIESDPMRLDGSTCPAGSMNPEKRNMQIGARASPLRRLFEPLLKPKGADNGLPSKARSSSSNLKPTNKNVPLQDGQKQDISTTATRALVQLTIRNGFPLFQFLVDDNSSSILGATMKSSDSSSKDDSVRYCTFYSVSEIKKKKSGSWLIHGSKEKESGFVYNVVGQMRLSNSLSSDLTKQKSRNHCPVRESVLFEIDLKQSDQGTEKTKASRELAAVVIKRPGENSSSGAPKNSKSLTDTSLRGSGDMLGTTTIILPGGVHNFPNKGVPSPLIDRWRSGGLCDCGGWDIGCKLRVLSNQRHFHEILASFQLFDQEGTQQNSPAFTMTPLKTGMYKVEFSPCMSPLQAFFICVTVITCNCEQQSVEPEFQTWSEETVPKADDETKKREMPLRCSPFNPPLSPVGRV